MMFNGVRLIAYCLRSETDWYPLLPLLYYIIIYYILHIIMEGLGHGLRQENKWISVTQIDKKGVKWSLFTTSWWSM